MFTSVSYFVEHNHSQTTQHVQKHSSIIHDIHGDFAKLPELSCYWSDSIGKILMAASPYLYPFCVEYSLICAGMSTKFSHSMLTAWRVVINCLQKPLISMGHVTFEWGTDVVSCQFRNGREKCKSKITDIRLQTATFKLQRPSPYQV